MTAQLVINLPNENVDRYPDLFRMLEMHRTEFGIKGMGLSCTTMEEVFLRYAIEFVLSSIFIKINNSYNILVGLRTFSN